MALGRSSREDASRQTPGSAPSSHPGEPGIGPDLAPPFVAGDEPTRWLFSLNRFGIRPGLSRIEGLLADLGHPERDLKTLVTAGTNGKGSTTRILARLLQEGGHKVATYTSPHLLKVHERIQINDRAIEPEDFASRVQAIRPAVEKHQTSWFETLTALAVQIARDEEVEYLCCETGLGGRLDASNALPAIATLLTTVGLDHQRILGETLPEIAAEKLGLLKRGVPFFCGLDASLRFQAFQAAVMAGSPGHFLDELARWDEQPAGGTWDLTLRDRILAGLPDPGTGAMRRNMALALLALSELTAPGGGDLLPEDPAGALGNLFLPGRYQRVFADPTWIFDTAHNNQALTSVLNEFLARPNAGRRVVIFGAMYDKDIPMSLGGIMAGCDHLVGAPVNLPRSRTADELADLFGAWGRRVAPWSGGSGDLATCAVAPDLPTALSRVVAWADPGDEILVTGSCFSVAEALHVMGVGDLTETRVCRDARAIRIHSKEDRS